jgi:mono/diheme cytochrome c family protein
VLRAARGLIAGLTALVVATGCKPLDDTMVAIFGRSMRNSRAFDPYENARLPAENAVPFASGNFTARSDEVGLGQSELAVSVPPFTQADMAPPGTDVVRLLENPVPADSASLAQGQVLFERFCAVCHGPQGISADAPIIDKLPVMGAWNLATGNSTGYTDGYIYGMIRVGRGAMPAYGHRVPHWSRWQIVNYVRELQRRASGGGAAGGTAAPAGGQAGDTLAAPDSAGGGG